MLSKEEVARNAKEISSIIKKFVRTDSDNPAIVVDNADWLKPISYIDFLRDVGVHFNVNEMLTKDLYKNRLEKGGLTFMEMGYMLMQSFDFVYLNDEFGCVLQIGGSDQWGNICGGVELSRKMNFLDGKERPLMMGLTCQKKICGFQKIKNLLCHTCFLETLLRYMNLLNVTVAKPG